MKTIANDSYSNAETDKLSESESSILSDFNDKSHETGCHGEFLKPNEDLIALENYDNKSNNNNLDKDHEEEEEERDLTNLTWLTELRNQTIGFVNMQLDEEKQNDITIGVVDQKQQILKAGHSQQLSQHRENFTTKSPLNLLEKQDRQKNVQEHHKTQGSQTGKIVSANQAKRPSPAERYEMFLNKIKRDLEIYQQSAINYQSDIAEKPPFNYSHIIGMAMLENGKRVTLQQICSWIEMKFAFFRVRKKWNNSIRHNLSLHPCFRKIGRNKEDKGKGGYWELGVDPKKCDRKRIRNRKSSSQPSKSLNKPSFSKTSKKSQPKISNLQNTDFKYFNEEEEHEYEELILDEMDVQQNIDVTSTSTNTTNTFSSNSEKHSLAPESVQTHSENIANNENELVFLTDIRNSPTSMHEEFIDCPIASDHIHYHHHHHHHEKQVSTISAQSGYQQEYKLGTIIISSTSMAELANINPSTLNSLLSSSSMQQLTKCDKCVQLPQQQRHPNIVYAEDHIPQTSKSVIISSYMPKETDESYSTSAREPKSNLCHRTSTNSSNAITLDFSGVQLMQPSLTLTAVGPSTANTLCTSTNGNTVSSSTEVLTAELNNDYSNNVNDNFRPYIDGIDEAFQYLRSMDNTRNEDILDNLLDISVSDY